MKRLLMVLLLLVAIVFSFHNSLAERYSELSIDDLLDLRLTINEEIASRLQPEEAPEGSSFADLFSDPLLAKYIRDQLGAFSTKDEVTQEQLDTITDVHFLSHTDGLKSLEGIQYLHGIKELSLYYQEDLHEIPDAIGTLLDLKRLSLDRCGIDALPDSIANLTNLEYLSLKETNVSSLPEDIGNLAKLKTLNISGTKISQLPSSIYNLELEKFLREGIDID